MKIDFSSISKRQIPFSIDYDKADGKVNFSGTLTRSGSSVELEGKLTGNVEVTCGVSCQAFFKEINEELCIKFVKGPHKGFDTRFDIIEIDDAIDLAALLAEEIESFKLEYHIIDGEEFKEINF